LGNVFESEGDHGNFLSLHHIGSKLVFVLKLNKRVQPVNTGESGIFDGKISKKRTSWRFGRGIGKNLILQRKIWRSKQIPMVPRESVTTFIDK